MSDRSDQKTQYVRPDAVVKATRGLDSGQVNAATPAQNIAPANAASERDSKTRPVGQPGASPGPARPGNLREDKTVPVPALRHLASSPTRPVSQPACDPATRTGPAPSADGTAPIDDRVSRDRPKGGGHLSATIWAAAGSILVTLALFGYARTHPASSLGRWFGLEPVSAATVALDNLGKRAASVSSSNDPAALASLLRECRNLAAQHPDTPASWRDQLGERTREVEQRYCELARKKLDLAVAMKGDPPAARAALDELAALDSSVAGVAELKDRAAGLSREIRTSEEQAEKVRLATSHEFAGARSLPETTSTSDLQSPRLLTDGKEKLADGRLELASRAFRKLLDTSSTVAASVRTEALYRLGESLLLSGKEAEAAQTFDRLLAETPQHREASKARDHLRLIRVLEGTGSAGPSPVLTMIPAYEALANAAPDDAGVWCRLVVLHTLAGDDRKALDCQGKARALADRYRTEANRYEAEILERSAARRPGDTAQ